MMVEVRETLAVSEGAMENLDMERFNLKKLNKEHKE
jgi:hypothetical protein